MNNLKFKVTTYLQAQNWQRIGAMLCIGFFAVCVALYFSDSSTSNPLLTPEKPSQNSSGNTTLTTTDVATANMQSNTSDVALKDPFKIPEKFKALPPAPIIKAPASNTPSNNAIAARANAEIPKIKLTGIIGSGATREAIVEVNGKSRSYKKMDMIIGSPYQLIYMTASAAVFRDSRGEKITLTIGR